MHAITDSNNITLSETLGRGGCGGTSQVQGDMSSSSDKNIHGRKRVVNHCMHSQIRKASLCRSLPRIARSGRQTVSQLPSPPEISQEDLKHNKGNKWPCLACIFSSVWQLPMMTGFLKILSVYVRLARASFFKEMTPSASSNRAQQRFFNYFLISVL